jgi:hypothetical protein
MPLLRKIVYNNPLKTVVKWTGSGTDTLNISTDILDADRSQTVIGGETPKVNIMSVFSSTNTTGEVKVTRNAQDVVDLFGVCSLPNQSSTYVFDENNTSNIAVSLSQNGTLILELRKLSGYQVPNVNGY